MLISFDRHPGLKQNSVTPAAQPDFMDMSVMTLFYPMFTACQKGDDGDRKDFIVCLIKKGFIKDFHDLSTNW